MADTPTLPNKEELEAIRAALKEAQAIGPNAEATAVKAFSQGAFTLETVESWLAVQRADTPKMFTPKAGFHIDGGEGERKTGKNPFSAAHWNVTEQGRLVKLNPQMAAALAEAAGVKIGATRPAVAR